MSKSTQSSKSSKSTALTRPGTEPAKGKKEEVPTTAVSKAGGTKPGATVPWQDLPAGPTQKTPREKTVQYVALQTISAHEEGATLDEIKAAFCAQTGAQSYMANHDPKTLLVWMSRNRGWGFVMNPVTGKIRALTA